MELRVLQYFLAIAREQSISGAANYLHISQPTLSRQIRELEMELGKPLFVRGNRKITLTEEGMLLRRRAEEIVGLVKKAEKEIIDADSDITGDICIGAGESNAVCFIAETANQIHKKYPSIHYHIASDDASDILEQLDKGLIDFGLIIGEIDKTKYDFLKLPVSDTWGILMRKDAPLAQKEVVLAEDIVSIPLLISRQINENHNLSHWFAKSILKHNIITTYNLVYNASIMVAKGNGYALTLDKLINTSGDSTLCFRPLYPKMESEIYIVWKKYQRLSKSTEAFLHVLKQTILTYSQSLNIE